MKRIGTMVAVLTALLGASAHAQEATRCAGPQIGTWALQAYESEVIETHEKRLPLGEHPSGFLMYGTDCRMQAILIRGARTAPSATPTEAERAQLYDGLLAYAGSYTVEGDRFLHKIDASWNQTWTGTTIVRIFKIEGDVLTVRTIPAPNPFDSRTTSVGVLRFTKVR